MKKHMIFWPFLYQLMPILAFLGNNAVIFRVVTLVTLKFFVASRSGCVSCLPILAKNDAFLGIYCKLKAILRNSVKGVNKTNFSMKHKLPSFM